MKSSIGETLVVGRIDRIDRRPDGTVAIIDYKTGKARDQEDADESLQLSLYAIAAKEKWGYKVGALIFHNLEENVPVITMRNESELIAARQRVEDGRARHCGRRVRCEDRHSLQLLRLSESVPREGEAHSASRVKRWPSQLGRTEPS